jgi:ubiquinone/menaquinone biosynthesis C-methylase UbiE
MKKNSNIDKQTVEGFGDEWERFDQQSLSKKELQEIFDSYFSIFPWNNLPSSPVGFDLGCGSGRWAKLVAPRVMKLHCIDPSSAIDVAKRNLINNHNCEFHHADVETMPLEDASMDFGYSLGVLHHVPDTQKAMVACVKKLKPGAPFLVYLYYAFENRPIWFRALWKLSNTIRRGVSSLPHGLRYFVSQIIAGIIYLPLARTSFFLEKCGLNVANIPLSAYRNRSFYTMRTDALDRFGTILEQRFTKNEINKMMETAGLENITFSKNTYWCAVGFRKNYK